MNTLDAITALNQQESLRETIPTTDPDWGLIGFTATPEAMASQGAYIVPYNSINVRQVAAALAMMKHFQVESVVRDSVETVEFKSDVTHNGFSVWDTQTPEGVWVCSLTREFSAPNMFNPGAVKALEWRTGERFDYNRDLMREAGRWNRDVDKWQALPEDEQEEWMQYVKQVNTKDLRSRFMIAGFMHAGTVLTRRMVYVAVEPHKNNERSIDQIKERITDKFRKYMWKDLAGFMMDEYPGQSA